MIKKILMEASNRGQNHPNKYFPKGFLNRMKFKRKILRIIIIKIIIIITIIIIIIVIKISDRII